MTDSATLLALLALVVSTGSLVISWLSWRTSGARVNVRVSRVGPTEAMVTVANNGRLGVPVKAARVEIYFSWAHEIKHALEPLELEGPPLPYTVNAGDDQEWTCGISDYDLVRKELASTPPKLEVKCGSRWVRATIPPASHAE